MSIKQYSEAQLKELAMIEIAYELLKENKTSYNYHALLKLVAEAKGLSEKQVKERIAHLYTEMSMDGRFVNIGDNNWALRSWYPFDQTEEELSQTNRARKKKRDEDEEAGIFEDEEDFDEFEDLEDELDELASEEDSDLDEDDDEMDDDVEEDIDGDEEDDL
ncbi:DNA-directed RNA polymerase subunit delta [Bacillus shivajii]|uniref:DNA-directed RNA polymerase subunit delta n=1 Tax=Bacillus shivajii TaxID=1983719 RepID=UPI001CF9D0F9|nr:DNA-directed RNA polymerase subunit delta [Bacillus shivajii]UCZ53050.1 DNA-directed RNA polymerase subunit delta [Bacillus shivajii]